MAPYNVGAQVNLCQSSVSIETQMFINNVYYPFHSDACSWRLTNFVLKTQSKYLPTYRNIILSSLNESSINYVFEVDNLWGPFDSIASNHDLWFAVHDSLGKRICRKPGKYNLKNKKLSEVFYAQNWEKCYQIRKRKR